MSAPGAHAAVVARARELYDRLLAAPSTPDIDLEIGELFPTFERWMRPDDEAYFGPLDLLATGRIRTPARQTGGWYDMFCEGGLEAFAALSSELDPARAPQRMLVGPWSHIGAASNVVGDHYFGPGADPERLRLVEREIEWLRAALQPGPRSELGHRLSVYVLGRGDWIDLRTWPPADARVERWQLGADGTILEPGKTSTAPGERVVEHDPERPLPTHGGRGFGYWPRSGPLVGQVESASDAADPRSIRYVSAPVEQPVTVVGRIAVELELASGRHRLPRDRPCRMPRRRRFGDADRRTGHAAQGRRRGSRSAVGRRVDRLAHRHGRTDRGVGCRCRVGRASPSTRPAGRS